MRVKDVMFPLGDEQFVPGYYIELWIKGFPAFSYVIDAVDTPDVLFRKNLTSHVAFKYRVHNTGDALFRPHDGPAPGTPHPTGRPGRLPGHDRSRRSWSRSRACCPATRGCPPTPTTTDGNNCIAYADLARPERASAPATCIGKVTAPRTFDYTYDHAKPASDPTNLQNSLVGMFFHVNWLHDRWYEAGFDEASGNAQTEQLRARRHRRRPDPGRGQRLQRHRQRQHVDARRRRQPAHADVRVHRHRARSPAAPATTRR